MVKCTNQENERQSKMLRDSTVERHRKHPLLYIQTYLLRIDLYISTKKVQFDKSLTFLYNYNMVQKNIVIMIALLITR